MGDWRRKGGYGNARMTMRTAKHSFKGSTSNQNETIDSCTGVALKGVVYGDMRMLLKGATPRYIREFFSRRAEKGLFGSDLLLSALWGIRVRRLSNQLYSVNLGGNRELLVPSDSLYVVKEIWIEDSYRHPTRPLSPGDIVIDAGAHVGVFTVKAANIVGPNGVVVAVEPHPANVRMLRLNAAGYRNIIIANEALGVKCGYTSLYQHASTLGHSTVRRVGEEHVDVPMTTIDALVARLALPRVDYLKMDVEGAELGVLQGALDTIRSPGIRLTSAAYHQLPNGTPQLPDLEAFLIESGFRVLKHKRGHVIYAWRE